MPSPLGPVRVTALHGAIASVTFLDDAADTSTGDGDDDPLLREAVRQLRAYFDDKRFAFDLPLSPLGTPFQRRVWTALQAIPPGTTTSYGALAHDVDSVARAVGTANGQNPIAIVIPCHRVIGQGGALTGYAGGLSRKRWLLQHEGALLL
jgi:methylated-DNA-[protein]-cysteine S-methyltransferase